jgi:hypothetical protein
MALRLLLESEWRGCESHVARHPIGIGILELFRRMHRVSARRARMHVVEKLLQACLWDASLDSVNGERMSRVVNRRSHNPCRFAHATPGLPCGRVRERKILASVDVGMAAFQEVLSAATS